MKWLKNFFHWWTVFFNSKIWTKRFLVLAIFSLLLGGSLFISPSLQAQDCNSISCNKDDEDQYLKCVEEKQSCWSGKIQEAQSAKITLQSTINILNGQIGVLELEIDQSLTEISSLEKQIVELADRIEGLDFSLDKLTNVLVERVGAHYKRTYKNPLLALLAKGKFTNILAEYKYLQLAQQQTVDAMSRAETQRITYDEQKALKQEKQDELEAKRIQLQGQKDELASKKSAEQTLLTKTQNDEAVFQKELEKTKAEYQAIQAIIAGRGNETAVSHAEKGQKIASVISGASCNSSGTHLHFMVAENGVAKNPFNYLRGGISYENCSGSGCGASDGDAFNPSGEWDWPIPETIQLWQGYGSTWAIRNSWVSRLYSSHNGIDIKSLGSLDIKAVQSGDLYRGSYSGAGGCQLRYVRLDHDDSNLSTYYLHVNY